MEANRITKITSLEFIERIVLQKRDAVLNVTSTWNGAGQMLNQILEDLTKQFPEVSFFSIEYAANSELVALYRLEEVATVLFFKKGILVDRLSGLTHRSFITEKIQDLVKS